MPSRLASLAAVILLAACGTSPGASSGGQPSSGGAPSAPAARESAEPGEPTPGTNLTACALVTAADIEAALTLEPGTVAEGVHRETPTVLSPGSNECRYEGDDWGGLLVIVIPEDGVNNYDAVVTTSEGGIEVDLGDASIWYPDSLRGFFLQGPVMILLQFTFIVEPGADFQAATVSVGEAALARL